MPLNSRASNTLITTAYFNDIRDLLTGTMKDQEVTIQNNLALKGLGTAPTAPTLTAVTGTGLGIGTYIYAVTFKSVDGESKPGSTASITTTSGNQKVNVSAIPTGPTGTTGRNLYRTVLNGSSFKLLTTIADNTTTTFADTTVDGSLGASAPTNNTFGGSLLLKDSTGATTGSLSNDAILTIARAILSSGLDINPPVTSITGTTAGSATLQEFFTGTLKCFILEFVGYQNNTATEQHITLPVPFTYKAFLVSGITKPITPYTGSSPQTNGVRVFSTINSTNLQSTFTATSLGFFTGSFDGIGLGTNEASTASDFVFGIGI